MPNQQAHQRQIASNEAFYTDLNTLGQKYFDWRITTLFYIIVHYADALCAANGIPHISDHRDRETKLQNFLNQNELTLYKALKNASENARYDVGCLNKSVMAYWQSIYQNYYHPLRTSLQQRIP